MTTRKVIVEVVDAHNLMPKDGEGSSSPFVMVNFDDQCKRTRTKHKDLNPVWNEKLEFTMSDPELMTGEELVAEVCNDTGTSNARRNHFLGRVKLLGSQFPKMGEETLIHYPLQNKSILSLIKGNLGLKIYYIDEPIKPPDPPLAEAAPVKAPHADPPVETLPTRAPVESPLAEAPVAKAPPAEAPPVEAPSVETPPAEAPLVQSPPPEEPLTDATPAKSPPAEALATETPPVDAPPNEAHPTLKPHPLMPLQMKPILQKLHLLRRILQKHHRQMQH
eukprot:Gb_34981 [translate_table: standard]